MVSAAPRYATLPDGVTSAHGAHRGLSRSAVVAVVAVVVVAVAARSSSREKMTCQQQQPKFAPLP